VDWTKARNLFYNSLSLFPNPHAIKHYVTINSDGLYLSNETFRRIPTHKTSKNRVSLVEAIWKATGEISPALCLRDILRFISSKY
jgi:hypothetical protein